MPRRKVVRERNKRGFHLSYKICQEPVVCAVRDEVFWTEDLIEETTKRLHEHDMSAQLNSSLPNRIPRVFVLHMLAFRTKML